MDNQKTDAKKRSQTKKSYSSAKLRAKRERKRLEAEMRNARWRSLPVKQKIISLRNARGDSKKQLARLEKLVKS